MFRNFKSGSTLVLAAALTATSAFAASHMAGDAAVEARHNQMELIAYNTGLLGSMAKGEMDYDAALATSAATNLNAAASLDRATLWIEGTEQGAVEGSRAKAEIWSDPTGFDEHFTALIDASARMMDAAGTDLDALRGAMGPVGGACKDCHETYRGPRN